MDTKRFDAFFDSLCCALYFERYEKRYDPNQHEMNHIYLSFMSKDAEYQRSVDSARNQMASFFDAFCHQVEHYEAAKIDEVVYGNRVVDPAGANASITIMHSFYGCFEVISLLTTKRPLFVLGQVPH